MSIGITVPLPAYYVDVALIAKKAEELGFESIWCAEHPIIPVHSDSPFPVLPTALSRKATPTLWTPLSPWRAPQGSPPI